MELGLYCIALATPTMIHSASIDRIANAATGRVCVACSNALPGLPCLDDLLLLLLLASCSQSLSTVIWYVPMCPNISSPCFVLQSLPNHTPKSNIGNRLRKCLPEGHPHYLTSSSWIFTIAIPQCVKLFVQEVRKPGRWV